MKKSLCLAALAAVLGGPVALASVPAQDKPMSKTTTTTTTKKTNPAKSMSTTKTVHKKHVKTS